LRVFLYLAYAFPLLEPLAKVSHVQFSVLAFAVLLGWTRLATMEDRNRGYMASPAAF